MKTRMKQLCIFVCAALTLTCLFSRCEKDFLVVDGTDSSYMVLENAVTDYDGNTYNAVKIGNQWWMKENLKTTHYANGTSIAQGSTYSSNVAYWYYPNNDASNKVTYGLLYNWKAVMGNSSSSSSNPIGVQGICPTGWHVPSDAEWTELEDYCSAHYAVGGDEDNIAKALASTTGWAYSDDTYAVGNNPSSNNKTGFSALPAGYCGGSSFYGVGYYAGFWSATSGSSNYAYCRFLISSGAGVYRYNRSKDYVFSVRCVRDN